MEEVYQEIGEQSKEVKGEIAEVRRRQEDDFRYLNQRIDSLGQRIDAMNSQLNQRFDTIMQLLVEIAKQKNQ